VPASSTPSFGAIVNGAITMRDHVEAPGRAYIAAFGRHMDIEETKRWKRAAGTH